MDRFVTRTTKTQESSIGDSTVVLKPKGQELIHKNSSEKKALTCWDRIEYAKKVLSRLSEYKKVDVIREQMVLLMIHSVMRIYHRDTLEACRLDFRPEWPTEKSWDGDPPLTFDSWTNMSKHELVLMRDTRWMAILDHGATKPLLEHIFGERQSSGRSDHIARKVCVVAFRYFMFYYRFDIEPERCTRLAPSPFKIVDSYHTEWIVFVKWKDCIPVSPLRYVGLETLSK